MNGEKSAVTRASMKWKVRKGPFKDQCIGENKSSENIAILNVQPEVVAEHSLNHNLFDSNIKMAVIHKATDTNLNHTFIRKGNYKIILV
jgi:hypothetical protein